MLGPALLVAPIFTHDGAVEYYVPRGRWTHVVTGAVVDGPAWHTETHDFLSLPLLARPNSVIPVGADDSRPDYAFDAGVTLRIYEFTDGARSTVVVPALSGTPAATFEVRRTGSTLTIEPVGATQPWHVLLINHVSVAAVDGGSATTDPLGTLIAASEPGTALTITLDN
jgi:alpha-D-xyloside xylohydrolase